MPAVVESLDNVNELPVEPGREAVARFSVRNTGNDVNNFTFRILGEPGLWLDSGIRVVGDLGGERKPTEAPPELDLLPNAKGEVQVTFRPPPSFATPPGLVPYELLVCSNIARNDKREEQIETVQSGLLDVATFRDRDAQLLPRTSRGRYHGRHRLAIDNRGNSPAVATFLAEDAENFLEVRFRPKMLVVAPGTAALTRVRVKPRRLFLLGPPRAAPFKIFVTFGDAPTADGAPPLPGAQIPPVDGLYMQRAVIPTVLIPVGVLLAAAVILWALFRPQPQETAVGLSAAQQAATTQAIAKNANSIAAQSNALTRQAIKQAHDDATKARNQAAMAASAAQKQAAQAAKTAHNDAKQTQDKADTATAAATRAGAKARAAARTAGKALQAATPSFTGTPFAQQVVQPFTAQSFPGHAFYVTDVVVGNPGGGKGTVTLTLGGAPVLVEPLAPGTAPAVTLSTPLLVQRDQTLAVHTSCAQDPCTPSVFVSGFAPAKPPDAKSARGTPSWRRLSAACRPAPACATLTVPASVASYRITDVIFQNPAGDAGTVTLSRGGQRLLAEGVDASRPGDLALSLAAPIVLKAGEKLSLSVACRNASGTCTASVLLVGVQRSR